MAEVLARGPRRGYRPLLPASPRNVRYVLLRAKAGKRFPVTRGVSIKACGSLNFDPIRTIGIRAREQDVIELGDSFRDRLVGVLAEAIGLTPQGRYEAEPELAKQADAVLDLLKGEDVNQ